MAARNFTNFGAYYRAATRRSGGTCPIEAGIIARLADHECRHGRLPGDPGDKCGCWLQEAAIVVSLTAPLSTDPPARKAA